VSYADLQVGTDIRAAVHVTDAFDNDSNLGAMVRLLGVDKEWEIGGSGQIEYQDGNGAMVVEASAGNDYEVGRFLLPRHQTQLELPMVRREWIQSLTSQAQVTVDPAGGRAVGFFGSPFELQFRKDGKPLHAEVIYFDRHGQEVADPQDPRRVGFVAVNLLPGTVDVSVQVGKQRKTLCQSVYVEPSVVDVLTVPSSR
jgi:hypothetical protein